MTTVPPTEPPPPVELEPDRKPVVVHKRSSLLPRPLVGGVAAAAGATLGAAAGASFLFWGSITPGTPSVVLLLGAVATPALAAFLAGSAFVALAIERPALEDFGAVAGCTAIGCLALGLIALGVGGGSLGSIGTGCDLPSSCCGSSSSPAGPSSGADADDGALWATASAGVGAAAGLGVGALVGLTLAQSQPGAQPEPTLAWSAGAGMLVGAVAGAAIGGAAAGMRDDTSAEREAAKRPAPARAGTPR